MPAPRCSSRCSRAASSTCKWRKASCASTARTSGKATAPCWRRKRRSSSSRWATQKPCSSTCRESVAASRFFLRDGVFAFDVVAAPGRRAFARPLPLQPPMAQSNEDGDSQYGQQRHGAKHHRHDDGHDEYQQGDELRERAALLRQAIDGHRLGYSSFLATSAAARVTSMLAMSLSPASAGGMNARRLASSFTVCQRNAVEERRRG